MADPSARVYLQTNFSNYELRKDLQIWPSNGLVLSVLSYITCVYMYLHKVPTVQGTFHEVRTGGAWSWVWEWNILSILIPNPSPAL